MTPGEGPAALFARVADAVASAEAAFGTAPPGNGNRLVTNPRNPTPALGAFETTNPCGEVPLAGGRGDARAVREVRSGARRL